MKRGMNLRLLKFDIQCNNSNFFQGDFAPGTPLNNVSNRNENILKPIKTKATQTQRFSTNQPRN
jgi:hypothetical protein